MKRLLQAALAMMVALFLTAPVWAGQGKGEGHAYGRHKMHRNHSKRSNKYGKVRGKERAEEVQEMNKGADKNRGFTVAPGVEKAEGDSVGKNSRKPNR